MATFNKDGSVFVKHLVIPEAPKQEGLLPGHAPCSICGRVAKQQMFCVKSRSGPMYCSKECQTIDWYDDHKIRCQKLERNSEAEKQFIRSEKVGLRFLQTLQNQPALRGSVKWNEFDSDEVEQPLPFACLVASLNAKSKSRFPGITAVVFDTVSDCMSAVSTWHGIGGPPQETATVEFFDCPLQLIKPPAGLRTPELYEALLAQKLDYFMCHVGQDQYALCVYIKETGAVLVTTVNYGDLNADPSAPPPVPPTVLPVRKDVDTFIRRMETHSNFAECRKLMIQISQHIPAEACVPFLCNIRNKDLLYHLAIDLKEDKVKVIANKLKKELRLQKTSTGSNNNNDHGVLVMAYKKTMPGLEEFIKEHADLVDDPNILFVCFCVRVSRECENSFFAKFSFKISDA